MYCSNCGYGMSTIAKFCRDCGQPQRKAWYHKRNSAQALNIRQRYNNNKRLLPGLTPIKLIVIVYLLTLLHFAITQGVAEAIFYGIWLIVPIVPTFLPTYLGNKRSNNWVIFWINLLTAWTIIGWFVALSMSISDEKGKRVNRIRGGKVSRRR